jgi:hypothetical protein
MVVGHGDDLLAFLVFVARVANAVLIRYHFDYESAQIWRSKVLEMSKHDPLVQQPCQGCDDATWAE